MEWSRLKRDPFHNIEFEVTKHYLKKYLPKHGSILDLGGGPGRYTITLARQGYDVVLVDISRQSLLLAERKIREAKVKHRVRALVEADAADLHMLDDSVFDAALVFGPFYHIIDARLRMKTLRELLRVCKRGAPIFITAISRYGVFRTVMQRLKEELTDPQHADMFTEGIHRAHRGKLGKATPDYYFDTPSELRSFCEGLGVKTICMTALEGLSSNLQAETNLLAQDRKAWKAWMKLIFSTSEESSILGSSEHFLYIGRKG